VKSATVSQELNSWIGKVESSVIDETNRRMDERFARMDERIARIEAILLQHSRILDEHTRMLQVLPEAVREKIGFRPPT
jgi:hypothetical protein